MNVGKMAQWIKALDVMPDSLNLIHIHVCSDMYLFPAFLQGRRQRQENYLEACGSACLEYTA